VISWIGLYRDGKTIYEFTRIVSKEMANEKCKTANGKWFFYPNRFFTARLAFPPFCCTEFPDFADRSGSWYQRPPLL
jgi:hypothetical protein